MATAVSRLVAEIRQHLGTSAPLHERAEAPGSDLDWADGDRSAPRTPWGPAQDGHVIAKDVIFYGTAGHGGLRVSNAVANKMLSDAAKHFGESWGGAYWYEEDVAINIPFYEVEAWRKSAAKWFKTLGSTSEADLRKTIERWFPEYLKLKDDGYKAPATPKVGETWQFIEPMSYGPKLPFEKGDKITVTKLTGAGVVFSTPKYPHLFRLRKDTFKRIEKVE